MLRTSLDEINVDMDLNLSSAEYEALVAAWGVLTPWPGTKDTLQRLAAETKIMLAPLSNGDVGTLKAAMDVFLLEVNMTEHFIFSSDFPVGSFKPDPAIYAQVPEAHGGVETIVSSPHLCTANLFRGLTNPALRSKTSQI
jgi:FMN phosphatase YigB (HAD superfamily)